MILFTSVMSITTEVVVDHGVFIMWVMILHLSVWLEVDMYGQLESLMEGSFDGGGKSISVISAALEEKNW